MKELNIRLLTLLTLPLLLSGATYAAPSGSGDAPSASTAAVGGLCYGQALNLRNVDDHIANIESAINDIEFWNLVGNVASLRSPALNESLNDGLELLEYAHKNLLAYKNGDLHIRGGETCKPAYSCTQSDGTPYSAWGFNSCAECVPTTPPGVPPGGAGATSCKMCCAHFGRPECGCDDNDPY